MANRTCSTCGSDWAPTFKFCPEDGTSLASPESAQRPERSNTTWSFGSRTKKAGAAEPYPSPEVRITEAQRPRGFAAGVEPVRTAAPVVEPRVPAPPLRTAATILEAAPPKSGLVRHGSPAETKNPPAPRAVERNESRVEPEVPELSFAAKESAAKPEGASGLVRRVRLVPTERAPAESSTPARATSVAVAAEPSPRDRPETPAKTSLTLKQELASLQPRHEPARTESVKQAPPAEPVVKEDEPAVFIETKQRSAAAFSDTAWFARPLAPGSVDPETGAICHTGSTYRPNRVPPGTRQARFSLRKVAERQTS